MKDIELVRNLTSPDNFTSEFYQTLKQKVMLYICRLFQRVEKDEIVDRFLKVTYFVKQGLTRIRVNLATNSWRVRYVEISFL